MHTLYDNLPLTSNKYCGWQLQHPEHNLDQMITVYEESSSANRQSMPSATSGFTGKTRHYCFKYLQEISNWKGNTNRNIYEKYNYILL